MSNDVLFEYVKSLPIGSEAQYWVIKNKGVDPDIITRRLFDLVEMGYLKVKWMVEIDTPWSADSEIGETDVSTENIYEYIIGKSNIYCNEYGIERDAKRVLVYFVRIPTAQEFIDAQKQGLTEEEITLLREALKQIEELDKTVGFQLAAFKRTINQIATNGVNTSFNSADVLK